VLAAALDSGLCDVVMFPVGPHCDRRYTEEILPAARARGVGVVSFKTFGAGKLLGDTAGYNQPLPGRAPGEKTLPALSVGECVGYTLTCDPDVALLGLSTPEEQDAAFAAAREFRPLSAAARDEIRRRAAASVREKGRCWWDP
jgi:aryl-alcohol dehydrogenase-like predicted oxidoreductase